MPNHCGHLGAASGRVLQPVFKMVPAAMNGPPSAEGRWTWVWENMPPRRLATLIRGGRSRSMLSGQRESSALTTQWWPAGNDPESGKVRGGDRLQTQLDAETGGLGGPPGSTHDS